MTGTLLDGITARAVATDRYRANVLERKGGDAGTIVFIHGNVSSSLFWQPTMLRMPSSHQAIAIDLRGFGDSETLDVDATRGLADFSDDVAAVVAAMGIESAHFVGWSMGGGVVQQLMLDYPKLVATATLQAPVSPYGFGATAGADGHLMATDAAGCGAGGANPDFVARLEAGDTSADEQTSPRTVYRTAYVTPGFESEHEDLWVESMLSTKTGDGNYPGTSVPSENWPGFAPGNLGVIPGWPGEDVAPAQPMVTQTRAVLEAYAAAGGSFREVTLENCGHSPHLEHPDAFDEALLSHIR